MRVIGKVCNVKILYWRADTFAAVTNSAYDSFAKAINKGSGCFIGTNTAGKSSDTLPATRSFSPTRHCYRLHMTS